MFFQGPSVKKQRGSRTKSAAYEDPDKVLLLRLAEAGDVEGIKSFLVEKKKKIPQEYMDEALLTASINEQFKVMDFLLNEKANINYQRKTNGTSILAETALAKKSDAVKYLLAHGADVNSADKNGDSPLMKAVSVQDIDIVKNLVLSNAEVSHKNLTGKTPLILTVRNTNADIMQYLLDHGAEANGADKFGLTAVMLAAFYGQIDAVRALVSAGSDLNKKDDDGHTALYFAIEASKNMTGDERENQNNLIRFLNEQGAKE
ncbi:MAG: ankyrin repeat domain-containing protein [Nitrospiria bacterium]